MKESKVEKLIEENTPKTRLVKRREHYPRDVEFEPKFLDCLEKEISKIQEQSNKTREQALERIKKALNFI